MAENQGTKGNQTQRDHIESILIYLVEDPLWVCYDFEVYSSVGLLDLGASHFSRVKMWSSLMTFFHAP